MFANEENSFWAQLGWFGADLHWASVTCPRNEQESWRLGGQEERVSGSRRAPGARREDRAHS